MNYQFEYGVIKEFSPNTGKGLIRFDGNCKAKFVKEDILDPKAQSLLPKDSETDLSVPVRFVLKQMGTTYWAEQITRARGKDAKLALSATEAVQKTAIRSTATEPEKDWETLIGTALSPFLKSATTGPIPEETVEFLEVESAEEANVVSTKTEDVAEADQGFIDKESLAITSRLRPEKKMICLGTVKSLPTSLNDGSLWLVRLLERDLSTGLWSGGPVALAGLKSGTLVTIPRGSSLDSSLRPNALVRFTVHCVGESDGEPVFELADLEVERIGYAITTMPPHFWTTSSRLIESEDPFAQFYLQVSESLIGPWCLEPRGASFELTPVSPDGIVWEHLVEDIRPTAIVEVDDSEYVLPLNPKQAIRYLDSKIARELTDWFIEVLSSRFPAFLSHFESEYPNWRSEFETAILDYGDPVTRELSKQRWEKVDRILDALVTQYHRFEELVNGNETLHQLLRMNVQHRLEELESEIFEKAEQEAHLCLEKEREELGLLHEQIRHAKQELIEAKGTVAQPETLSSAAFVAPAFDAIDQRDFCARSLGPNVARWVPHITVAYSESLHLATLCARNVLVPDFAWGRGFSQAFVQEHVIYDQFVASPAWLAPDDFWRAGMGELWAQALGDPDKIFIGHIANINSSMMQYWALPFLLSGASISPRLSGLSPSAWPNNLRLLWSPVEEPNVFALPNQMQGAFSAACPPAISTEQRPIDNRRETFQIHPKQWFAWTSVRTTVNGTIASDLKGPFARPISDDLTILQAVAEDFTRDQMKAEIYARSIRLEWVKQYFEVGVGQTDEI